MDAEHHSKRTVSGIKWSVLNQIAIQAFGLTLSVILARLLGPEVFGTIAMITVLTGFLDVISRFGLSNSLIQKTEVRDVEYQTIFWLNVGMGTFAAVLLFITGFFVERFYEYDGLRLITWALATNFVVQALSTTQLTIMRKELDFKRLFVINTGSVIISGVIAIVLAYGGLGVWSLVLRSIIGAIVTVVIAYSVNSWRPKLIFDTTCLSEHISFSVPLLGSASFRYWTQNIDNLLIGKFFGNFELGLYSRSYSFLMLPVTNVASVIAGVMFPSMALIKDDADRLRTVFFRMNSTVLFLIAPLMTLVYLEADSLVRSLLGNEWMASVALIKTFALIAPFLALSSLNGSLIIALGRTKLQFRLVASTGTLSIAAIVLGMQFGLIHVAWFYGVSVIITLLVYWYFTSVVIQVPFSALFINIRFIVLSTILTVLTVFFVRHLLAVEEIVSRVIVTAILVLSTYLFYSFILKIDDLKRLRKQIVGG